jgi:hypothetical protein
MTLNLHQNTDGNSIRDLSHGAIGPYFFVQQAECAGLGKNRTMADQWTAIIQGSNPVAFPCEDWAHDGSEGKIPGERMAKLATGRFFVFQMYAI